MSDTSHIGEFCWNELMTNNTAKATHFYSELLGWQTQEMDMGDFTYTLFKSNNKDVGGMMQIPQDKTKDVPPNWLSYICVADVEATAAQAEKLGAIIKVPPTLVGDFGRFIVIADPTGAHVAFWQSLKPCKD